VHRTLTPYISRQCGTIHIYINAGLVSLGGKKRGSAQIQLQGLIGAVQANSNTFFSLIVMDEGSFRSDVIF
jgi:hypothetical protein